MSIADAQRFAADIANNKELAEQMKAKASGLASLVEAGKAKGYDLTVDELKQVIRSVAKRELTDDELEAIVGGQGAQPSAPAFAVTTTGATTSAVTVVMVMDFTQTHYPMPPTPSSETN